MSPKFTFCPRCESRAYENLKTHSYCIECNYSPTADEPDVPMVPVWALLQLGEGKVQATAEECKEFPLLRKMPFAKSA